ncbi:MAG: orotate phosphoribosyltransferase [Actinomycetota bacterium]|nr:orotate phosphoribosyltransferase [Actinomycetota bacterium]
MNPNEIMEVLEKRGAVQRGHFRLSSGLHSDLFVQKFRVFEHPRLTQRFGDSIAQLFAGGFDAVASPAFGAVVLGFATALAADVRVVFAEREGGALTFRRGFELAPHERVLVVEDVITTGGSAREVVDLVQSAGASPVGVGALIDRASAPIVPRLAAPLKALIKLEATSWAEQECPLCKANDPLADPGSRRLNA